LILSYTKKSLPLKKIFRVANSSKSIVNNVFIEIAHGNTIGVGEAAASEFYGENTNTIVSTLKEISKFLPDDPLVIYSIMEFIEQKIRGNYSAKAAVNIALYDLIGKIFDVPVYKVLGLDAASSRIVTSVTIGIDSIDKIRSDVIAVENYPILKVKLGTDIDYEIIECIRGLTSKPIRVDANEGWDKSEAVEKINWLEKQNVELVEQPLLADDLEGMRWVQERVRLPIIADESVRTSRDIPNLLHVFDGINIKLMKCGGISEAIRIIHTAKSFGLLTMIGCFIETSVGITAAAHLSALCDYVDLDGHLFLNEDPYCGVSIDRGMIELPDSPGLGVGTR